MLQNGPFRSIICKYLIFSDLQNAFLKPESVADFRLNRHG